MGALELANGEGQRDWGRSVVGVPTPGGGNEPSMSEREPWRERAITSQFEMKVAHREVILRDRLCG